MVVSTGEQYVNVRDFDVSIIVRGVNGATHRCSLHGLRRVGSSSYIAPPDAVLMNGDIDNSICRYRDGIARWHAVSGLAGPARLDPVLRHVVVVDQRVAVTGACCNRRCRPCRSCR